ncbi:unnamed protein product [Mytilus coruscus]|uniref:Uncharacterized protein n=1 Tax=Mytilus coruscus TaxID=42192 RepID=A0A6J8EW11_MYTCO|nr:unnamed protein product [Mytilus coruscus]
MLRLLHKVQAKDLPNDCTIFGTYLNIGIVRCKSTAYGADLELLIAVVDYVCVPHDIIENCKNFEIITCNEIIESERIQHLIGTRSRIPDHAFLIFDYIENFIIKFMKNVKITATKKRLSFKEIPANFMCSEVTKEAINMAIRQIELCRKQQEDIDMIYEQLCKFVTKEMKDTIPYHDASRKIRKHFKHEKPFWNQE